MFSKILTVASLASAATAHMVMSNPVPYGQSSLNNSPLDATGSDFPCKLRTGGYDLEGASNVYEQGSTQSLSFLGTAVHGGGSCQISITTDLEPSSSSVFKVIKSIEGGCPAKNQAGNMGDSASAVDPYTYDYTIPSDLAAGNYTIAWTWFNKVGNREMYMNCAPLTVTGSSGSESALDSLPDLFVANINSCTVDADHDVLFPDPGDDVDQFNGSTEAWWTATGEACSATSGSGSGDSTPTTTAAAAVTTTAAPGNNDGGDNSGATSAPGGVFITVSDSPATTEAPVATTPVANNPPAATTSASSDSGSGSSSEYAAGTSCSNEGEWNCVDGTSFQRCASGTWSAVQDLSSGVSCTPGESADLALSGKRSIINLRRALRIRN